MPREADEGHPVSPFAMDSKRIRELGNQLVERIAGFLDSLPGPSSRSPSEANSRTGPLSSIVSQCDFACASSVVFPDQCTV